MNAAKLPCLLARLKAKVQMYRHTHALWAVVLTTFIVSLFTTYIQLNSLLLTVAFGFQAIILILVFLAILSIRPPSSFPHGLPTIPFYVTLKPLVFKTDQAQTFEQYFREHLHKHGAAKIFFGSRWNVLVSRPEYIRQVFKDEDTFAKSGNQIKIPYSVLAGYTGENIISATGEKWRCYRDVIQPGLEKKFDDRQVKESARRLVHLILEAQAGQGGSVEVAGLFQRYTMENLGKELLGVDFKTLDKQESDLHKMQLSVKREIFKPLYLNFPVLDRLPIPSRQRARQLSGSFADALIGCLSQLSPGSYSPRQEKKDALLINKEPKPSVPSRLGYRLLQAWNTGRWNYQQLRHNMIAVFLAGHENPQLNLVSAVYLLAKHTVRNMNLSYSLILIVSNPSERLRLQCVQNRLRSELLSHSRSLEPGEDVNTTDTLNSLPYLAAVTLEILRMYPPISQLINRRVTRDILLGGTIPLREGTYVGYNCYSTHRDPSAWGPDADEFKPERWGSCLADIKEEYRRRKSRAEFIAFHGGRRACLGEKYALMHFKATMCELLLQTKWVLDCGWEERMTPVSTPP